MYAAKHTFNFQKCPQLYRNPLMVILMIFFLSATVVFSAVSSKEALNDWEFSKKVKEALKQGRKLEIVHNGQTSKIVDSDYDSVVITGSSSSSNIKVKIKNLSSQNREKILDVLFDRPAKVQVNKESFKSRKITIVVQLPSDKASWSDFAFLAAVPAASYINNERPSLLALKDISKPAPEVEKYLSLYKPSAIFTVGGKMKGAIEINTSSAEDAACKIAGKFFNESGTAVVCDVNDYKAALSASTLAGRIKSPLLFLSGKEFTRQTLGTLKRLKCKTIIYVGDKFSQIPKFNGLGSLHLKNSKEIIAWLEKNKYPVDYLTALNVLDRGKIGTVKKLSLSAPLLAVARSGMVVPLEIDCIWRRPFEADAEGNGFITLKSKHPFQITGNDKNPRISFKQTSSQKKVLLSSASNVKIENRDWVLSAEKFVTKKSEKSFAYLSWPQPEKIKEELKSYILTDKLREYLVLVGYPDVLPSFQEASTRGLSFSDLEYGNIDDDPFVDIAYSRLIAEDIEAATLYSSRVITYQDLDGKGWLGKAGVARWDSTIFDKVFKDFNYSNISKYLNEKGVSANAEITNSEIIAHADHSGPGVLGKTYNWNSDVLISPAVIESGGCSTSRLHEKQESRYVVARLLKNGAVIFYGNSNLGIAEQRCLRDQFWNYTLSGHSVGEAHIKAVNTALLQSFDHNENKLGYVRYSAYTRMLFGDPAFTLLNKKRFKAPDTKYIDDQIKINFSSNWGINKFTPPPDWKDWHEKGLFHLYSNEFYTHQFWNNSQKYNKTEQYVNVELTTPQKIKKIIQNEKLEGSLGWNGKYYVDEHPLSNQRTYYWTVRVAEFDDVTGTVERRIKNISFTTQ